MASHDQNSTTDRGSTSPVHSLTDATSTKGPHYSYNQPDHSHYDSHMRTSVPKEDPILTAPSTAPATKESRPPPVPPKHGLYQPPALIQQTRIEDYKPPPPVIPIDGEESGPAPQTYRPVVRESLSSEPELSSGETRRPRAASSAELGAPRPPARSASTPAFRRRRTSRERDDGSCRLTSPPPGLRQHSSPQEYRLMGRSQASPLSVLKRAAHLPQSSSLQNSSDHPESDHIQRPPYTLSRIFLLLGGFFIIGVAPAARALPQQEGIDPTQTTSSFDWWPYPAWGASSLSAPVLMTAISTTLATTQSTVVPISTDSVIPIPSSSGSASFKEVVDIPTESTTGASGSVDTTIQITALPQSASTSSQDAPTASPRPSTFKPIYLLPVTIVGGAILGACVTAFLYSRRYNVRKPLLRGDSTSAGFPANRGYHGVEEWDDEEDKRDDDEKHFIAQPDDSGGNSGVDGGRSSSSNQYPESDTLKAKSDFSRARTRRTEYDDIDSWYAREGHIEEDSKAGLSDEEPFSPYARLSDFRKPRATSSGQELPDYDQDDPAQSLLPTSADRPGVFRRRVTPIHMRGHGRTDSNTVIQDVLRVPDTTLEGKLLPPSPASVYPEDEDLPLQKETPPLPRPSNYSPPWSSVYRYHENSHSRDLSQRQSQLAPSDLSSSNPPRFSTVGGGDSLDLNLVLEDERGPRVLPKRSGKVSKDFPASVSASSTFVNPPSRFAHKLEPDSQQASSRVDDILRRSWDQRDVSYQPSSPTGFGAIIDDRPEVHRPLYGARQMRDGGRTGTGQVKSGAVREEGESIEERLANLRRKDNRFDRT